MKVPFKVLAFVFSGLFILSSGVNAAYPFSEGSDGTQVSPKYTRYSKRNPAQTSSQRLFPRLSKYQDMSCFELLDGNDSKDHFKVYLRENIDSAICEKVGPASSMERDSSQAEREAIGLGTFSKLIESHYEAYLSEVMLPHYMDLSCFELMNKHSKDEFIRFFAREISKVNSEVCSSLDSSVDEGSDISQAERPIGRGTFSKLIEVTFEDFRNISL